MLKEEIKEVRRCSGITEILTILQSDVRKRLLYCQFSVFKAVTIDRELDDELTLSNKFFSKEIENNECITQTFRKKHSRCTEEEKSQKAGKAISEAYFRGRMGRVCRNPTGMSRAQ